MAKKRLLIIFAILIALALLVVLGGTLFTLKKASMFFLAYDADSGDTLYVDAPEKFQTVSAKSLVESVDGKSVFFFSSQKLIEDIHQQQPQLKVVGLRRVFPNKVEIFLAERIPLAYFAVGGYYYLIDEDLNIMETDIAPYTGYICIEFGSLISQIQTVGKPVAFSQKTDIGKATTKIFNSLWQVNFDFVEMPNLVKTVTFDTYKNCESIVLKTKTGANIWVVNPLTETKEKVVDGFSVYVNNSDGDHTGLGVDIYCFDPDSKQIVID